MEEKYLIITFESTHMAIKTERSLSGTEIEMIPTPRQLSAACGLSIKAKFEDLDTIKEKMGKDYGHMNKFYLVLACDKQKTFKVI